MTGSVSSSTASFPSGRAVWSVLGFAAIMCLLAPAEWPYGYYRLLRLVATSASLCGCVWLHRARSPLVWPCGLLVLLYNPLFMVHFSKDVWSVMNLLSGVLLLVCAYRVPKASARAESRESLQE